MKGAIRRLPNRGDDVWQARWYVGTDPSTGRKIERTRTFRAASKRQADELGVAILAELRAEAEQSIQRRGTIGEYSKRWLDSKRRELSPTTIDGSYSPIVDRIAARFGHLPLDELRPTDIKQWYGELADKGLSQRTIDRHHGVLRAMYREAVEDGEVDRVPTSFRRRQAERYQLDLPPDAAIAAAIAGAHGDFANLVRIAALTGMRRGELVALRWNDLETGPMVEYPDGTKEHTTYIHVRRAVIELKGGELVTKTTKAGNQRRVLVGQEGIDALDAQRRSIETQLGGVDVDVPTNGPIFADVLRDPTGMTPRRPGWVTNRWKLLREKYGLDDTRLHDLRHAHATRLLRQGVSLNDVADRLGHMQTSTTLNTYGHPTSAGELAAVRASGIRSDDG